MILKRRESPSFEKVSEELFAYILESFPDEPIDVFYGTLFVQTLDGPQPAVVIMDNSGFRTQIVITPLGRRFLSLDFLLDLMTIWSIKVLGIAEDTEDTLTIDA
jgi:hypothetical protein